MQREEFLLFKVASSNKRKNGHLKLSTQQQQNVIKWMNEGMKKGRENRIYIFVFFPHFKPT